MLTDADWLRYMGWDWYTYATPQEIAQWTPYVEGLVARQQAMDAASEAYNAGTQARIDAYDQRAALIQYDATGRATDASIAAEQAYAAQVYAQAAAESLIEQNAPAQALDYLSDSKALIVSALTSQGAVLDTGAPLVVMTVETDYAMRRAAEAAIAAQAQAQAAVAAQAAIAPPAGPSKTTVVTTKPVVTTFPAPAQTPSTLVPIEAVAETTPQARGISYGTLLLGGAALLLLLRR